MSYPYILDVMFGSENNFSTNFSVGATSSGGGSGTDIKPEKDKVWLSKQVKVWYREETPYIGNPVEDWKDSVQVNAYYVCNITNIIESSDFSEEEKNDIKGLLSNLQITIEQGIYVGMNYSFQNKSDNLDELSSLYPTLSSLSVSYPGSDLDSNTSVSISIMGLCSGKSFSLLFNMYTNGVSSPIDTDHVIWQKEVDSEVVGPDSYTFTFSDH